MHKSYSFLAVLVAILLMSFTQRPSLLKKNDVFVYIPGGELKLNELDKVSVSGFFMATTEVTNAQYKIFLADLEQQSKTDLLAKAKVMNELWMNQEGFNQPLAENYFFHPAYDAYPVVNISFEAAQLYCQWLAEKLNEFFPKGEIEVRLPSPQEWTYAARGGHDFAPYPWGGYYIKNNKDCYLANFSPEDASVADGGMYTIIADGYFPNDYGLYNTVGNVAEMTNLDGIAMGGSWKTESPEDITVESKSAYEKAAPTIGFRPVVTISGSDKEINLNKAWKKIKLSRES